MRFSRANKMASDILIVDDEEDIRELVSGLLEDEGYETRTAGSGEQALAEIDQRRPSLVFLDIWMQGSKLDGLDVLDLVKEHHPDVPVVMISGHGNIETAVSAIRRGAYDYIEKPFKADRLILVAHRALEASGLRREVRDLKSRSTDADTLIGSSPAISQLKQMIGRIGPTNSRILISGPTGSGKELVARTIHAHSARNEGPFVAINAAQITPDRMEEELFGVEASAERPGKVGALEEAHNGTLYFDEIANMPQETQGRILRVLVEQKFLRVGGGSKVSVNVRIISSTATNLENRITLGSFRRDLYDRLNVVPVTVASLAERRQDIPELVQFFMKQISQITGLPIRNIGADALAVLQAHNWPGNLRQLRNNVERLMILTRDDENSVITADLLPSEIGEAAPSVPGEGSQHLMSIPLREARELFEREYLTAQIARFGGNISRTSEFVGMERSALHRKLKSLGIS